MLIHGVRVVTLEPLCVSIHGFRIELSEEEVLAGSGTSGGAPGDLVVSDETYARFPEALKDSIKRYNKRLNKEYERLRNGVLRILVRGRNQAFDNARNPGKCNGRKIN